MIDARTIERTLYPPRGPGDWLGPRRGISTPRGAAWDAEEIAILRAAAGVGAAAVLRRLPGRSKQALHAMARRHGVRLRRRLVDAGGVR